MKSPKALTIIPFVFCSFSSVSADEYKFDNIKFDQAENAQNTYQPKDKLDEYIINGATYSTKFVPLMNDGAEGSEYTSIMADDLNRLLVDAGFNFANAKANGEIQKIPFFAQTSVNISGGTESDTSFSLNSLIRTNSY